MSQHDEMDVDTAEEVKTKLKRKTDAEHLKIGSTPGGAVIESARKFSRLTAKANMRAPSISITGSARNAGAIEALEYANNAKRGLLLGPKDKDEEGRMRMKYDPKDPENTKEHDNLITDYAPLEEVFGESASDEQVSDSFNRLNQSRRAATQSMANTIARLGSRNDGRGIAFSYLAFPASCVGNIISSSEGRRILNMPVQEARHHLGRFEGVPDVDDESSINLGHLIQAAGMAVTAGHFKKINKRLIEVVGATRKRERTEDDEEDHPAEKKAAVTDGDKPKPVPKKSAAAAPKKPVVEDQDEEEAAPAPKKPAKKASAAPKKPVVEDQDEEEEAAPAPKKPAKKPAAAPKKPVAEDQDEEEETAPAPKKPAKKASAAPKKPVAPVATDDEEEHEETSSAAKKSAAKKSAAAPKKQQPAFDVSADW